jgi:hypothetical protein
LLEDEPKAKKIAINSNRDMAYMLKPAVGSLRAIPSQKKPSESNGSALAATKPRTGEKRLKF